MGSFIACGGALGVETGGARAASDVWGASPRPAVPVFFQLSTLSTGPTPQLPPRAALDEVGGQHRPLPRGQVVQAGDVHMASGQFRFQSPPRGRGPRPSPPPPPRAARRAAHSSCGLGGGAHRGSSGRTTTTPPGWARVKMSGVPHRTPARACRTKRSQPAPHRWPLRRRRPSPVGLGWTGGRHDRDPPSSPASTKVKSTVPRPGPGQGLLEGGGHGGRRQREGRPGGRPRPPGRSRARGGVPPGASPQGRRRLVPLPRRKQVCRGVGRRGEEGRRRRARGCAGAGRVEARSSQLWVLGEERGGGAHARVRALGVCVPLQALGGDKGGRRSRQGVTWRCRWLPGGAGLVGAGVGSVAAAAERERGEREGGGGKNEMNARPVQFLSHLFHFSDKTSFSRSLPALSLSLNAAYTRTHTHSRKNTRGGGGGTHTRTTKKTVRACGKKNKKGLLATTPAGRVGPASRVPSPPPSPHARSVSLSLTTPAHPSTHGELAGQATASASDSLPAASLAPLGFAARSTSSRTLRK